LDQEINMIDSILQKYPKVENKTTKVQPPTTTTIPPIKTVATKPVKKKPEKKIAIKKEITKPPKKETTKPKKEPTEKKKPKKEKDTTTSTAVKKDTKKDTTSKKEPKKDTKKEPKKEVKPKKEKEPTAVKKEPTKKKEEVAKKDVGKKEAPKKSVRTKPKNNKTKKFERCKSIIESLMLDPLAGPFNVPVDYVFYNIPEYPKLIKEPMDFGTIKKTLETGQYTEVSEFISDIELVFENCWKFNGVESEIGKYATHLSDLFKSLSGGVDDEDDDDFSPAEQTTKKKAPKKKPGNPTTATKKKSPAVKKKEDKVVPPITPAPTKTPSTRRKSNQTNTNLEENPQKDILEKTIKNLSEELRVVQEEMLLMKKKQEKENNQKKDKPTSPKKKPKSNHKAPKKTPVPLKKEDARPMSFKEKHDLSLQINNLDGDNLGEVVKLISERMPELANNTAPDEIEIDIDALDAITLRHLERFVKNCNTKKKRSNKRPHDSPENLTLEDKQLKVIEAAHATSSSIRELERELASMEGRPIPPPIDVPLSLPVKKNQKSKKNSNTNDIFLNEEDSISDSDLMSSEDENDDLQIVPTNILSNSTSVSFDVQSGFIQTSSHLLSSNLHDQIQPNTNNGGKKDNNVVIKNIDQWNLGDDNSNLNTNDSNSNQPFDKSGELWKKLQNRETINKQKEKEREMIEYKQKLEKEKEEREKREKLELIDKEKREKERKIYEEQERERLEHERKREEERLRAVQEYEQSTKTVDLQDQHDMIENFEKSLDLPYN